MSDTNGSVKNAKSYSGADDPPVTNTEVNNAIAGYIRQRTQWLQMFMDGRRDIEEECGYIRTEELQAENYYHLYERESIAERVVSIFPSETWQIYPRIVEDEDSTSETEFETAIEEMGDSLGVEVEVLPKEKELLTFHKDQDSNPLYGYFERADRLAGIGHYGAILLGVNDGRALSEPLELGKAGKVSHKLLYIRVLDETCCRIRTYVNDSNNRRYGKPETYSVTLSESLDGGNAAQPLSYSTASTRTETVHWTRVIHVVDTLDSSEIIHVPRMRTVWNRLYDLHKLYGGSAEMYWQAALPGISFETHPQLGGQVDLDVEGMRGQLENYMNSLQRWLAIPGLSANQLSPTVVDPASHIDTYITAICINKDIPKRVFMGSEVGELSSSQDIRRWLKTIMTRRTRVATPRIIVPTIDRLIRCGVLPKPSSYRTEWEDLAALTESEIASVATQKTQAMASYVSGNVETLMQADDFLVRVLGYGKEEALEILKATEEAQSEQDALPSQQSTLPSPDVPSGVPQPTVPSQPGNFAKQQFKPQSKLAEAVTTNALDSDEQAVIPVNGPEPKFSSSDQSDELLIANHTPGGPDHDQTEDDEGQALNTENVNDLQVEKNTSKFDGWKTFETYNVYVENFIITKGPKHLRGKKVALTGSADPSEWEITHVSD